MITVIKTPSNKNLYQLVKESDKEMILCAPFIKEEVVDEILKNKQSNTVLQIITSFNISHFLNGSLDIKALKKAFDNGARIINCQRLHAKIYFFDSKKALITSANLTNGALFHNYEYGVLFDENEKDTIDKVYEDFVTLISDKQMCGYIENDTQFKKLEDIIDGYKGAAVSSINDDGDAILSSKASMKLSAKLTGWDKEVFACASNIKKQTFEAKDIYKFEKHLKTIYPNNNHVLDKIRQALQHLRDFGFIKFVTPGYYKKLWR